jgi:hypothetical protein
MFPASGFCRSGSRRGKRAGGAARAGPAGPAVPVQQGADLCSGPARRRHNVGPAVHQHPVAVQDGAPVPGEVAVPALGSMAGGAVQLDHHPERLVADIAPAALAGGVPGSAGKPVRALDPQQVAAVERRLDAVLDLLCSASSSSSPVTRASMDRFPARRPAPVDKPRGPPGGEIRGCRGSPLLPATREGEREGSVVGGGEPDRTQRWHPDAGRGGPPVPGLGHRGDRPEVADPRPAVLLRVGVQHLDPPAGCR